MDDVQAGQEEPERDREGGRAWRRAAHWPAWRRWRTHARGGGSLSSARRPAPVPQHKLPPSHTPSLLSLSHQTFFALACGSDTYAACHGGDHPGGMLDVRVGEWAGLGAGSDDSAAAVRKALAAAASALASAAPKKGWAAKRAAAKSGSGVEGAEAPPTTAAPALPPSAPAVRALAYRMPPDWGDGWLTKREL